MASRTAAIAAVKEPNDVSLSREYYQGIESTLLAISNNLGSSVSVGRRARIQELIEEGEYCHALEGMAGMYLDEEEPAPYFLAVQILELATTTGIRDSAVVANLEERAIRTNPVRGSR